MEPQPKTEDLKVGPEVTIKELQQFFSSREVPFGDPGCLPGFSRRLTGDPAFHEEMTSMARFVLYSVQDGGPRTELLHILVEAVGGPSAAAELGSSREPLQILLSFVREVTRSQRMLVPSEMALDSTALELAQSPMTQATACPIDTEQPAVENVSETRPVVSVAGSEFPQASVAEIPQAEIARTAVASEAVAPSAAVLEPATTESTSLQDASGRLSAALLRRHAANRETPEIDAEIEPPSESAFAYEARTPTNDSVPGRARSWLQRAYWVPGVAVLLAVVLTFAYVRLAHIRPLGGGSAAGYPAVQNVPAVPVTEAVPVAGDIPVKDELATAPKLPSAPTDPPSEAPAAVSAPDATKRIIPPPTAPSHREPAAQDEPSAFEGRRKASKAGAQVPALPGHNLHTRRESEVPEAPRTNLRAETHEGVFLASSGSMTAHLVYAPTPSYPKLASFTRVQGQVIMQVVVARDGSVAVTRVLGGPRLLRGAAERAIRQWRYRPYVVDGKTTDVATIVTVTFKLPH